SPWQWEPSSWAKGYLICCAAYGALHIANWTWREASIGRTAPGVKPLGQRVVDIARALGFWPAHGPRTNLLSRLPGNQLWQLHVNEFSVDIPGLPAGLDG